LWAWLDLNQRPHPYQRWTAKRRANQRSPRPCGSVSATGMGWIPRSRSGSAGLPYEGRLELSWRGFIEAANGVGQLQ